MKDLGRPERAYRATDLNKAQLLASLAAQPWAFSSQILPGKEILVSKSLIGKTALVTGGSRGIGRSIAERLAEEGALVALTYNASKHGADETVATIEKAGGSAFAVHADLVDAESIPHLFTRLDDEFMQRKGARTLDLLINNAGNSGWGSLADATPDSVVAGSPGSVG